ncbi:M24 family metallopeptidase [Pseudoleptotrichia goodfellowii]|uniref:Creatinase n=1 Tax=Pseudoleptotrichia goodfellowii F0264 TaxID=596323 RepID=D0GIY0_9FUSO|nr:Xaa-Pro peptidase family protein [Pseudoleptotrichia goodfellowii]EEY35946.1 Creatinase [Pseudoleptotrichia goodfellowii F0264]
MEKRSEKLLKLLNELNVDGIFLTDLYNLRYFAGFTGTTGVALATKKGNFFYSDFRYRSQAEAQVSKMGFEFKEVSRGSLKYVGEHAEELGLKKIGFEDNNVTFATYQKLKEIFKAELVPVGEKIMYERMVKSDEEILMIKKAIEISDIAFSEALKVIKEGVSERELSAYMEYVQKKNGAEDKSFNTILASGVRSAMPHGVASDKKIQKEEFITMDFGAYYNGYVSDMTRTVYYGNNITERHKEIYNLVLEAQILGINTIKEGMMSDDVDKVVRNFLTEKGYGEYFGHGLGHGIGVEIHELPYLSSVSHIELKENMVVTSEPGLYFDGWGGVRIEDDVVVKKDGREVLNKSNKKLIIIEA